jgi:hypothetical protein
MVPLDEIFCFIDDFCKCFDAHSSKAHYFLSSPGQKRKRRCRLALSEVLTILVLFQLSHYRTFKDFYLSCLMRRYQEDFPKLVSYNRFLELIPYALMPLLVLMMNVSGEKTGKYFIDSTKLSVCHNLRIYRNKVFKAFAKRGKTSTGWFFGFKLHLILNNHGEIISFSLTPGNTDDRAVLKKITQGLQGWLVGDRGYISKKHAEFLKEKGLELITRLKKNMKPQFLDPIKEAWLEKRSMIETMIGQLKAIFHLQHTRHRSVTNFFVNVLAALLAYVFKPKKVNVSFEKNITQKIKLISS